MCVPDILTFDLLAVVDCIRQPLLQTDESIGQITELMFVKKYYRALTPVAFSRSFNQNPWTSSLKMYNRTQSTTPEKATYVFVFCKITQVLSYD